MAANTFPRWVCQCLLSMAAGLFTLTNSLLFTHHPPQSLFPSRGAGGSGPAAGRGREPLALQRAGLGASIPAAALQTARVCSGCSQRRGTSVPGLKAVGLRTEFGTWHRLGMLWELSIPGGAGDTDLWLRVCTELQLLVPITLSWLVGHPEGGFTHQSLPWAVVLGTG